MKIALDLGTTMGWAAGIGGSRMSGSLDMKPKRHENWSARHRKMIGHLESLESVEPITGIWYEAVRAHKGTDAAHIYGGFVTVLDMFCDERDIPLVGVPVGTIKKFATGKGNASKEAMLLAAEEKFGVVCKDDNEADAVALYEWALKEG